MSVQLFENENLNVSIESFIGEDNKIYFKAKDVAESLGYERSRDAVDRHIWEENKFEWCNISSNVLAFQQASRAHMLTSGNVLLVYFMLY